MATIEKRTFIAAPPEVVFGFHERPDALEKLTPPWEPVRIVERVGQGLAAGVRVTLEMKLGPIPLRWIAEHVAYDPPRMFKDVARSGPFRRWEHEHRVEPGDGGAWLVDHVEYALPLEPFSRIVGALVRRRLERMFAYRHDVTKRTCEAKS
jgi:ligand-binding SRPBCC domain-containing protein